MEQLLDIFGLWTWFIIGLVLLLAELLISGVFVMWLGISAIAVGLIDLLAPMSWQMEITLFAILSVVFLAAGRPFVMRWLKTHSEQPNLNQRNREFIGKAYMLQNPITGGTGTLSINDTIWRVRGPDTPAGQWVTVTGVDGMDLIVEPRPGTE